MNNERADKLLVAARRLGASETYLRGGHVHVRFTSYGPEREPLGDLHLAVSQGRSTLHRYRHTSCPAGVAWSRKAALAVSELDTVRRQAC